MGGPVGRSPLEPVTHSWFVDYVLRVRRVIAELLADLGDDVAGVVFVTDRVIAPDLTQQRGVRDRLARMERATAQEVGFGWLHEHRLSIGRACRPADVHLEIPRPDHWLAGGDISLPAQHCSNPRDQLLR